jgi:lipopolysaccharide/colanic/teichoic acid biosynthesis glycosyltransferase
MRDLNIAVNVEKTTPPLFFVGFSQKLTHFVPDLPIAVQNKALTFQEQPLHVLEHLLLLEESGHALPYALIFDFKAVKKDNYKILWDLTAQSVAIRQLPVILLSDRATPIRKEDFTVMKVDDCYRAPVYWAQLEARLLFLKENKPKLIQYVKEAKFTETYDAVKVAPGKRLTDIFIASCALVALSPLMLLIATMIWLESPGKVIYRSRRVGRNFDEFDFFKFRSMHNDADQRLQSMLAQNQYGSEGIFIKFANDPRITRVGRFIRKYSIDELPQLFNILRGEMSLVGNRPLPVYEAEQLTIDDYSTRFFAPAGLTGLWQVTKRGTNNMSVEERISLDVQYACENSMLADVKLLVRTATAFVQKENV